MIHPKFRLSDSKAMLASALQSVRNFDRRSISRYLLTLVALLAMTTGAWAEETPIVTITATGSGPAYSVEGIVTLETGSAGYGAGYGWVSGPSNYLTVTAADGVTITKVKFIGNQGGSWEDTESPFQVLLESFYVKNASGTKIGSDDGVTSIEVYGTIAPAGPEVTISTDQQSAEFDMPSYDATLEYQIVRNLASNVGVTVNGKQTWGDGTASIQVKKLDGEYPAASELITAVKDLTAGSSDIANENYTLKLQKLADDGETWSDIEQATAKQQPGTYRFVATAVDDKPYVGTAYGKFEITEGYEITVAAGEYATYYNNVALTVEDADAEMYTISNVTDTEAQLSDKLSIAPKETPLLIYNKGTEAKTFVLIPTEEDADEVSVAKEFRGTAAAKEMPASNDYTDYYVCTGNAFIWVKEAGTIAANRCWLQIGEQPAASRRNTRSITGGNGTTGIDAIEHGTLNSGDYYDLQGRKVTTPNRKGIYIKNGQKVIIK